MTYFHVDLDDAGQVTPSVRERRFLLAAGIFFGATGFFMAMVSLEETGIYSIFALLNLAACGAASVGLVLLYRGRNLYNVPLCTFFRMDAQGIHYKFSLFRSSRMYRWENIRSAEMSLYNVHLRVGESIEEIDLEEISNQMQRTLIKKRIREVLVERNLLRQAA